MWGLAAVGCMRLCHLQLLYLAVGNDTGLVDLTYILKISHAVETRLMVDGIWFVVFLVASARMTLCKLIFSHGTNHVHADAT